MSAGVKEPKANWDQLKHQPVERKTEIQWSELATVPAAMAWTAACGRLSSLKLSSEEALQSGGVAPRTHRKGL